jgi:hypothetical protein
VNTQSHILIGAVLYGGKVPNRAWAAAAGGIAPDVPMLAIVAALKFFGMPARQIFGEMYWENWWQITNAISHSFLLWGLLAFIAFARRWPLILAFTASGLTHAAIDFLCHREDAHMQFWPLTRWKFVSPVSYWDPAHFGRYFGAFEALLGLAMAVIIFRRFRNMIVRAFLLIAMAIYVAVPAYFITLG